MKIGTRIVLLSIIVLLIIIAVLCIHNRILQSKLQRIETKITLNEKPFNTNVKPIIVYTDTSNRKHIVIQADANKIKAVDLKQANIGTIKLIDSIGIALNLSLKDRQKLDQVTKANFELAQSNIHLIQERDSLKRLVRYHYKDKNLTLNVSKPDSIGNVIADYQVNTDLNWVDYSKRKWFLGVKKQFTDIYSDNPNITIKGLQRVTLQHAPSQFGLRLKASSAYNFKTNNLSIGPGLEIDLNNKLDISGFYFRNMNTGIYSPVVRLDYNIFNF